MSLLILCLLTAGFIGFGVVERVFHQRSLAAVPTRIHVSGTRGKSSVTRLIASGLREAGIVTAAKTTGTLARMILPDAREVPIFRPSGPNIIEQTRIVAAAADMGCQALVIECMALQPELHWLSENKLIHATHGVITNARADHLDVMGPTEVDVAKTLASMTPVGGVLYTAEQRHLDILREAAADRSTRLVAVDAADIAAITDEEIGKFSYTEHKENVALAWKVLADLGVSREVAFRGMWKTNPDPGALSVSTVDFFKRRIVFVNGFAANDPESTERIWRLARQRYPEIKRAVAVFNLRADRVSRTSQMAQDTTFWHEADAVLLMGTGAYHFARMAAKTDYDTGEFIFADQLEVDQIFESIVEACTSPVTLVIGMGNIGGQGLPLVRYFKNRALPGEMS